MKNARKNVSYYNYSMRDPRGLMGNEYVIVDCIVYMLKEKSLFLQMIKNCDMNYN